jgi:hypothetical protein
MVTVSRIIESGQACGGPGGGADVVVGVAVVVVAWSVGLADGELVALPWVAIMPVDGGLLAGARVVASGTPCDAPRIDGVSLPPRSAPTAQTNSSAPTAVPAVATTRRRR